MRIVIAPAAFKGTMTAAEAAEAIAAAMAREHPGAELVRIPMADGGDGTVDALLACGFAPLELPAADALGAPRATLAARRGGTVALELARTCGLHTIDAPAPRTASTLGLGLAMRSAVGAGASELLIGLGGSASTDGGLGLLLGLAGERSCDGLDGLERALRREVPPPAPLPIPVTALVDVASPLTGPLGAARAFGPQKGLDPAACAQADALLGRWAAALGIDPALPGAGAAGGAGAALAALGARLVPGGPEVARMLGLRAAVAGADLVVTGEGRLDATTLAGKAPAAVWQLAREANVPCRAIVGSVDPALDLRLVPAAVRLLAA